MLFNSLAFALFLPTVLLLYWHIPRDRLRVQNAFLLLVSYLFYGWWDWRFLTLLFISSLLDFVVGLGLQTTAHPGGRKALLACSLVGNLGMLGFFKYYNFFVDSFVRMLHGFGLKPVPTRYTSFSRLASVSILFRRSATG